MNPWLLAITVACYGSVSFNYVRSGEHGLSLAFLGYALGNAGLMWSAFKQ